MIPQPEHHPADMAQIDAHLAAAREVPDFSPRISPAAYLVAALGVVVIFGCGAAFGAWVMQ